MNAELDGDILMRYQAAGKTHEGKPTLPDTPAGFADRKGLALVKTEIRFEARRKMLEVRGPNLQVDGETHGIRPGYGDWIGMDTGLASFVRDLVARHAVTEKVGTRQQRSWPPMRLSPSRFAEFASAITHTRRCDAFREWLESLPAWDGTERLDNLLNILFYLATPENHGEGELQRWCGRAVLMTAVARTYRPGLKVDEVPVIIGPQGVGKSAFAAWLVPEEARDVWYTDQMEFQGDAKRQIEAMKGRAIVEFSEMIGLTEGRHRTGEELHHAPGRRGNAHGVADRPGAHPAHVRIPTHDQHGVGTAERPEREPPLRVLPAGPQTPRSAEAGRALPGRAPEQLWAEALHRVRALKQKPGLPRSLKEAQMSTNERHRARDAGVEEAIAEVFPKGVAYPGLTLEQIALLTDFNLKTERSEGKEGGVVKVYQPWAQIANRESARLRQALANVADTGPQWQQSASKLHARPDAPAYRWYTNNEDAPEADGFREEAAWRKHQSAIAEGDPNAPREGPGRRGREGDPSSPPQTKW